MRSKNEYEGIVAVMQSDIDHDMMYFEEHVDELEAYVQRNPDSLVGTAIGMVVVQIYLNKIRRDLEDV